MGDAIQNDSSIHSRPPLCRLASASLLAGTGEGARAAPSRRASGAAPSRGPDHDSRRIPVLPGQAGGSTVSRPRSASVATEKTPPRPTSGGEAGGAVERQRDGAGRRPSAARSTARRAEPGPTSRGQRTGARSRTSAGVRSRGATPRRLRRSRGAGGGWRASVAVWRAPRAFHVTVPALLHRGRSGGSAISCRARRDRGAGGPRARKRGDQSSSGSMIVMTGSPSSPGPITALSVTSRETPSIVA